MQQPPASDHEPELPVLMRSLAHHLAPPGPHVYQSLIEHAEQQQRIDRVVDLHLRSAARQSTAPAPTAFTDAVRKSLASATIAPAPLRPSAPTPLARRLLNKAASTTRRLRRSASLTERQWRAAVGGMGTLVVALVFGGVSMALVPAEAVTVLGVLSALLWAAWTVSHLVTAALGTILSSAILACLAVVLYGALFFLWVRLVRRPVEA